jgi:hypothetical protein
MVFTPFAVSNPLDSFYSIYCKQSLEWFLVPPPPSKVPKNFVDPFNYDNFSFKISTFDVFVKIFVQFFAAITSIFTFQQSLNVSYNNINKNKLQNKHYDHNN